MPFVNQPDFGNIAKRSKTLFLSSGAMPIPSSYTRTITNGGVRSAASSAPTSTDVPSGE